MFNFQIPRGAVGARVRLPMFSFRYAVRGDDAESTVPAVDEVVVIAQQLNEARNGIQTQTGASTYTINEAAIDAAPGGDNQLLNQVIMQAPDVAQDSFGQFHVRGEHNGLQYRLNGIILPEGISVFGQSLDPRLISSLTLITGALPAEYGLRTAGIIDLKTKSGVIDPGGSVSLYGGSHGTVEPSFNYGGSDGRLNYFVSGDFLRNDLGIESPDGSSDPIHDHTKQYHGFGYFEYILDDANRLSAVLSSSVGDFQIPNRAGLIPGLTNADGTPLTVDGQTTYPSAALNENQRELNHFAILSWQHSQGALDVQTSATARYSSLTFTPDPLGDLLFDRHRAGCLQAERGLCAAIRCGLQTRRCAHAARRHLPAERSLQESYHLAGDRPGCERQSNQRCAGQHRRQRRKNRMDRERVSAG